MEFESPQYQTSSPATKTTLSPSLSFSLPLSLLTLGVAQLAAEVLWRGVHQPLGVHEAEVPHVAARGVQQLVEHHVGRLGLEQHGGRVDGHALAGVQRHVGAVGLELGGVDEHPVGEAAPHARRVRPARLQLHVQLGGGRGCQRGPGVVGRD